MKTLLLHAWTVDKVKDRFYLPYTHWIYLKEISQYFDRVILLAAHRKQVRRTNTSIDIAEFKNVCVYELPSMTGYISSIKFFFRYVQAYYSLRFSHTFYARYPVPFGWLQKIMAPKSIRIIHYVGDPIDATKNNPTIGRLKKFLLLSAFNIENSLYNWACKGATVYTNGSHIADKLAKKGIHAEPLISSTLTYSDYYYNNNKRLNPSRLRIIYLGYLRKAKGVETVIRAFKIIQATIPKSILTIVGSGEYESSLKEICRRENIPNVIFKGHIDDRNIINTLLRRNDFFLFASLSEGSPRVILEAVANGLLVITTPVGSLGKVFKDGTELIFAKFNEPDDFAQKLLALSKDITLYNKIRRAGYERAKSFTLHRFIKKIFDDA